MNRQNKVIAKKIAAVLTLALMLAAAVLPVCAASYPKPDNFIADGAGILSEATVRTIRNANDELEDKVGAVVAVCTVSTTGDSSIGEYTRAVFNDWRLGESVLLLIAVDDMNYYFLQSTAIDKVLTNEELQQIARDYLEADFTGGSIDTGVMKATSKLASLLGSRLPEVKAEAPEQSGSASVGKIIGGIFKAILIIVLIAVVGFVVLFVIAMFNDDVAAFMRKYIFRKKPNNVPHVQYDERLYGSRERRPQQNGNGYNGGNNGYNNYGVRQDGNRQNSYTNAFGNDGTDYSAYYPRTGDDPYYNSDGTRRR